MKIDSITINLKGTEVTTRKTEMEPKTVLKKLGSLYDEHAKLVFLFDVSGSMNERVAKTFTDQYLWEPKVLEAIRARVQAAVIQANQLIANPMDVLLGGALGPDEAELVKLADNDRGPNGEVLFNPKDDEDLKERIVRYDLIGFLSVNINWARHTEKAPTRIDLVKRLAKQELENRFKKYPKSSIAVIPFATYPEVLFDDGEPDKLWPAIDKLNMGLGGGTDILAGIKKALDVCRANPSKVGVHHFVVVSDGEDVRADYTIASWLPALKASGVIMDYIHIGDSYTNSGLKAVCEALGGQFVVVNTERDFESRFVEVVNRAMIPAAS